MSEATPLPAPGQAFRPVMDSCDPIAPLHSSSDARRAIRVRVLLVGLALMGLGDLDMTLTYATSIGFSEGNPVARAIMSQGSIGMVVAFKAATMLLGLGLLYRLRHHRYAEWAAWVCTVAMLALTLHWWRYNHGIVALTAEISQMSTATDPNWVTLDRH